MLFSAAIAWPLLALVTGSAGSLIATEDVPLLGPSFLSNVDYSQSKYFEDAKKEFDKRVERLFSTQKLNSTDLVFTVDVFSAATNRSIYQYSHIGKGQHEVLTAGQLNDHTIGRLGSVTKLLTTYAILHKAGGMDIFSHPVTKYLPELRQNASDNAANRVQWEEVTVGALASHQAGSGGAMDVTYKYINDMSKFTPEALLSFMRDVKRPVIPPFQTAVYSDGGYALLGQVLARLTGKPYEEALLDVLAEPLGLNGTTATLPTGPDLNVINRTVIDAKSSWSTVVPSTASSGGIYSNIADLRTVGLSILNSELLSPATTRAWMKPMSGTGSLVELAGAPWEITRLLIPVTPGSKRTRICDLYAKAGGANDYTSVLALSPDHGIGYSIIVAGKSASAARWPIRQAAGEIFIPAAELAVAENAKKNLAGTFVAEDSSSTNLTLTFDEGKPGLGVASFYKNGTENSAVFLSALTLPKTYSLRAYPTGLSSMSPSLSALYQRNGTMTLSHRVIGMDPQDTPRADVEGGEGGLFDNSMAWMNLGYSGSYDELDFELENGKLARVAIHAFEETGGPKLTLKRVEQ